jgi:hypothetical protein
MIEALEKMHTHGRGLLRGEWWLAGPKLVFEQMAAPVPEIGCLFVDLHVQYLIVKTGIC